jgi:hypothetical protein
MLLTYLLHCTASRTSAMSSRPDWKRVWSCGSLTSCVAQRAERQPCRGRRVRLCGSLTRCIASEPNISHVVLTRREASAVMRFCGSLTSCIVQRAERQRCRFDSKGGGCEHAVHLLAALQREPNVSHVFLTRMEAGAVMRSCGSHTRYIAKRAERQPCRLDST